MTTDDTAPWWQGAVVYQIYPRSFADHDGDGVGDLQGVIDRLDHVAGLGVDAIWLSPFYRSPMRDFGYDVSDHTDVDPLFGDLDTFDRLLTAAHERGLRLLVDYIPNHTSSDHPWFTAARSGRDDPHRDRYVWRPPAPGGGPPNNWLSVFGGGPAWTYDEATGEYYLHSFLPTMPDLNWREPAVREAMFDVARFWLDRGVDGFRIDCAHFPMKDPHLRDNPPAADGALAMHRPYGDYDTQQHVHDKGHPDNHGLYRELRKLLESYAPGGSRIAVGEVHVFDWAEWATYYGEQLDELHMPFNFGLLQTPWRADDVRDLIARIDSVLPEGAWPSWVVGNHDEPRVASRIGEAQARVAMLLLLTLRGTPTLYAGDELALPDADVPPHLVQDPWGRTGQALGLGRDPQRSPMLWSAAPGAGFTRDDVTPWLPFADDPAVRGVEAQDGRPGSMLTLTRALLRLRAERPELRGGAQTLLSELPEGVVGYLRHTEGSALLVLLNLTSTPRHVTSTDLSPEGPPGPFELLAATSDRAAPAPVCLPLLLDADEAVVLRVI
ncbi:alpha-amylase family glycosyl hydrolase [Streptomyces formicae]|uniref:Alpha-glucosidase/glycosyl hydrolase n=1 Tax=Streptomyces formicae TaxID=1616117 RepID=A0A291Q2K4_9ACTN|nr:alpha-amylase family glycosyl hydrolase [Streptomyces formicae]ATL25717.1 Alpha-glucosidase/glycosyl hydrolase [Streptomyces formicae]